MSQVWNFLHFQHQFKVVCRRESRAILKRFSEITCLVLEINDTCRKTVTFITFLDWNNNFLRKLGATEHWIPEHSKNPHSPFRYKFKYLVIILDRMRCGFFADTNTVPVFTEHSFLNYGMLCRQNSFLWLRNIFDIRNNKSSWILLLDICSFSSSKKKLSWGK
jgi:hypothetical protein